MSLYNKIIDQQKLHDAWRQVYKNKPKGGVDSVTCEEFEGDKKNKIKELWNELSGQSYECMPVHLIPVYKGEKVRFISLYTIRINSFFDNVLHDVLIHKVKQKIKEEDVIELILKILRAPSLEKNGELVEKKLGIYQGSTVAPVLSNVYLMDMDRKIEEETDFYIRYSDDLLIFFRSLGEAEEYKEKISIYLSELGLKLNVNKTKIVSFEEGFEFLGYQFNQTGRAIPDKAENQLCERLEEVWLNPKYQTVQKRLEKGLEILNGWEQYFTDNRKINSILEYAVWVYQMEKREMINWDALNKNRQNFDNPYKDIAIYLSGIWSKKQMKLQELNEYESYYSLAKLDSDILLKADNPLLVELINIYSRYMIQESDEIRTELIQLYSDLKMYQKAEALLDAERHSRRFDDVISFTELDAENEKIALSAKEISRYMDLFVGREDLYALDGIKDGQRRGNDEVLQPLLADVVKNHLEQKETVGTYIQRSNGTVKYLVIDLDISKGALLQCKNESMRQEYMNKCLHMAAYIMKELRHMGMSGYLEQSGCRGYHIWIFFSEWIPVRYANLLSDIIDLKTGEIWKEQETSGIQIEYFPNKTRIRNGKKGQCIKLPWGIHPRTGKISFFLDSEYQHYNPQKKILEDIVLYSCNEIKRIISSHKSNVEFSQRHIEVDREIREFEPISETVRTVLDSCKLLRYLCQKARTTHYLPHFERLTILYVFGHLGDEGKEFVHKVMSFTLNYSYQTTQKFILRCPEKPISCLKLREQYKQLSAEIGCSCNFKRTKNCYPSPVLHALKNAEESKDITMPLSRSLPVNKQDILKEEINAGAKAQSIAEKMMELRKQRRNIDKTLRKYEKELADIFDDSQTDSMEIKMGLLVRRKNGEKTEWVIEL